MSYRERQRLADIQAASGPHVPADGGACWFVMLSPRSSDGQTILTMINNWAIMALT